MNNGIKFLIAVALNAFIASMYYLWQIEGIEQAGNIFMFWVWFFGITGSLLLFVPPTANDYTPRTFARGVFRFTVMPLTLLGTLWAGHIFAATVYAIASLSAEVRNKTAKALAEGEQ